LVLGVIFSFARWVAAGIRWFACSLLTFVSSLLTFASPLPAIAYVPTFCTDTMQVDEAKSKPER